MESKPLSFALQSPKFSQRTAPDGSGTILQRLGVGSVISFRCCNFRPFYKPGKSIRCCFLWPVEKPWEDLPFYLLIFDTMWLHRGIPSILLRCWWWSFYFFFLFSLAVLTFFFCTSKRSAIYTGLDWNDSRLRMLTRRRLKWEGNHGGWKMIWKPSFRKL